VLLPVKPIRLVGLTVSNFEQETESTDSALPLLV
jgi:hypothetical protein